MPVTTRIAANSRLARRRGQQCSQRQRLPQPKFTVRIPRRDQNKVVVAVKGRARAGDRPPMGLRDEREPMNAQSTIVKKTMMMIG